MPEYHYSVLVDNEVVARELTLPNALILAEALFDKWYNEINLSVTIRRDEDSHCVTIAEQAVSDAY